jgi:small-conductance mechanosensitive channel
VADGEPGQAGSPGRGNVPGAGWTPVPDPTALTTEAVERATAQFRRELAGLREVLEARMNCADAERRLLLQIMDERSAQIQQQFAERDARFAERDQARQDAVRTALDAAKELSDARDAATDKATGKFEDSVRTQIAQLGALAESGRDQLGSQIQALKERLDRGEGSDTGAAGYRTEQRLNTSSLVGIAGTVLALVAIAVTIIIATRH